MSIVTKTITWGARRTKRMPPTQIIILVFLAIIAAGALLLTLPVATRAPGGTDLLTALFTATSAVSVTGLTLVDTYTHWTFFGQAVILLLIQVGGLGFMSIISIFYFLLDKRIGLRDRLVIMESMNLDEMSGVVALLRHVLIGTLLFEFVGAVILSLHFIPEFGLAAGIWRGTFLAVSAFCNAGFHILGGHDMFSSLATYSDSPVVLLTMAILIVIGSTGFYVWEDILKRRRWKRLHVHSKLVLLITGILVVLGALMYLLMEGQNPNSLGLLPIGDQIMLSLFQSVSTRTAGFDVIGQLTLTEDTRLLSIFLMFIGGSSGSTAGGVKTVTIGILILSAVSVMRGRHDLTVFGKTIAPKQILNAATLVVIGMIFTVGGGIFIFRTAGVSLADALFETVAAYGTAGLSIGVIDEVGTIDRILLMCYMFFGKIGITSISIAFLMHSKKAHAKISYPTESVIIG
ncbi:MAG: potassium uptake protein, TrkH family [Oscillospiraceae bacterium]|nr:potassium uptake protein, TrkH family [Oscillospiraceae bacterium]